MKTSERTERSRAAHHKALETLCTTNTPGLKIWRKLRELERMASRWNEIQSSESDNPERMTYEQWDTATESIGKAVQKLFGKLPQGFFVNRDPRGYALKIESDNLPEGLHRDWGNYGILAPEIND